MSRTIEAARGKWRGILLTLGMDKSFLSGRHGPCPLCGGHDRYRWDNKDGSGSYFCSQCGAGAGMDLLMKFKGWEFRQAADEVDRIVGNVRPEPIKHRRAPADALKLSRQLWSRSARVQVGDPVSLYFEHRRIELPQNLDCLRYCADCPAPGESGGRTAMLAKVQGPDGAGATVHRTFITPQGRKADIAEPRAVMPGEIPDGAAVRLAMHGDRLGIAEGIETAQAASKRFNVPVWAAINATMLAKWIAPSGVKEVLIFGDNDPKFGGAAAAYALAHRLAARNHLIVSVHIPDQVGKDWADAA